MLLFLITIAEYRSAFNLFCTYLDQGFWFDLFVIFFFSSQVPFIRYK